MSFNIIDGTNNILSTLYINSGSLSALEFGGPTGPQGFTGADGPQGFTGADGSQGPQGFTGADGSQGPQGFTGADGPQGFTGADGPQGPQGFTGADGPQGPQGFTGADGSQGFTGDIGPQGDTGPKGDTGISLLSSNYIFAWDNRIPPQVLSTSGTKIQFDNIDFKDNWTYNLGDFTCNTSGLYSINFNCLIQTGSDGNLGIAIYKNSTQQANSAYVIFNTNKQTISNTSWYNFNSGDTFYIEGFSSNNMEVTLITVNVIRIA
jgi:uncharacterized protein YaiE (UPF0345 family)